MSEVLPAHAGVIPVAIFLLRVELSSSRTRGAVYRCFFNLSIGNYLVLLGILMVCLRMFKNNSNICRVSLGDKCKGT